jgi:hypothetical protein
LSVGGQLVTITQPVPPPAPPTNLRIIAGTTNSNEHTDSTR